MKAILWHDESLGADYTVGEISADMLEIAQEWREKMVESVAEQDEELIEKFFADSDSITPEELIAVIRKATIKGDIIPLLCGSAFKNKGVQTLLDGVCAFLPNPLDIGSIEGKDPDTDKIIERKPSVNQPLAALAFKIATDPFVGRLCFIRVYSGKIDAGSYVLNMRTGKKERISRLFQMHANKQQPRDVIEAGDICAAVGFKDIRTGDTLCSLDHPIILESMTFPEPVIGIAIEPKTQNDIDKLSNGLAKLAEEDPTFQVRTDPDSGQTVIRGMGELHLEIIVDRLKREFKVECNQGAPQVAYKEAVTKVVDMREVFKKQSGGRGKFADISIKFGPVDDGVVGLQFVDQIKGGTIPKEFIAPIEKGFKEAMNNGPLAGFKVENLKVVLYDGSFHPVDSDALSFELAARQAFRNAASKAKPVLLEPIMKVEVVTPDDYMGDIVSDLNRRRGHVESMDAKFGARVIKAVVPLAEQFGYVTVLRTLSSGRATSTMEFSHYAEVPKNIALSVLENVKGRTELL